MGPFAVSQWVAALLLCLGWTNAHSVIVYPGYRGNNLHTNGTVEAADGLGVAYNTKNDTYSYPYGMQWIYPCMRRYLQITFHPTTY